MRKSRGLAIADVKPVLENQHHDTLISHCCSKTFGMAALSSTCNAVSSYKSDASAASRASVCLRTTNFRGSTTLLQRTPATNVVRSRQHVVETQSFKFMKKLGIKKPEFLPDFGKVRSLS